MPSCCSEEDIIILDCEQTCSPTQRLVVIVFTCILYTDILRKVVWNERAVSTSARDNRHAETRDVKIVSQ